MNEERKRLFEKTHEALKKNNDRMKTNYAKYSKKNVESNFNIGDRVKYRNLGDMNNPQSRKKASRTLFPRKPNEFLVIKEIHENGTIKLRKSQHESS